MTRPVHLHVLRRWRLEAMGLRAGAGALVASLVAFASGVPSAGHLAAIVLGAALAAAWPARRDERRALGWVGERVGLAYETAWDVSRAPTPSDERAAALRSAVEVQGRLSVRDLRPPPAAAWWLPLATIAFGLWLWAAWSSGGIAPATAPSPGPPPTTTTSPPLGEEPRVDDASIAEPAAPEAPQDPATGGGEDGSGEATSAGTGVPSEGGAPAERDVLDRFLDRLRERPPEEPGAARTGQAAGTGEEEEDDEDADPTAPDGDALRRGEPPEEGEPEGDRRPGGEGDDERTGEPSEGEGESGTGDDADGETGDGGDREGEGPETAGEPGGGPDEGAAGGGEQIGVDEGSDEGSSGIGSGAPGESGPAAAPAAGDPEALPSLLGPGEESPIGGVQLPGVGPDGGFPSGEAGSGFRRGVEEALNEGDLPVAYQEVIRNYFR